MSNSAGTNHPGRDPSLARTSDPEEMKLRWYQARLGFWQAIWGTIITGGIAVAIPQAVEAYKIRVEEDKTTQEIALKNLEMDHEYINSFLSQAVSPDIDQKIRMSQYFAYISSSEHRGGWEKFKEYLEKRKGELEGEIIAKNKDLLKLKNKQSLTVDDMAQIDELQERRDWDKSELGKLNTVTQK